MAHDLQSLPATCSSPASRSTILRALESGRAGRAAIIDNYWQTETGWPILSAQPGIEDTPRKLAVPRFRSPATTSAPAARPPAKSAATGEKGVLTIVPPLPPGCMSTVWGDDERFVETYFTDFPASCYSTFDWAIATPTATTSCWAAPTT